MQKKYVLQVLKLCSFFIFLGRAYQHLFWDAPYRSLFWDQTLLEPFVQFFLQMTWQSYVTDLQTDLAIQVLTRSMGLLYVCCAILSLRIRFDSKKWMVSVLQFGTISLLFLSLLLTKEKFYHFVMFFEHSIQFGIPFLLLHFLQHKNVVYAIRFLQISIALTFTCHGMYAIGVFYPIPANFVTMTLNILPVSENMAKTLLFVAGILDFIIAIGIFIPKIAKVVLLYAAFWGLITALARILSGFHYAISLDILHQYLYLVIYRLPHGIIPFLVYILLVKRFKKTRVSNDLVSV